MKSPPVSLFFCANDSHLVGTKWFKQSNFRNNPSLVQLPGHIPALSAQDHEKKEAVNMPKGLGAFWDVLGFKDTISW